VPQLYDRPDTAGLTIHAVVPEDASGRELNAQTEVIVINRGNRPLTVKFDGQDHVFQAGYNSVTFGIAKHAQEKLIVPGSKNIESGGFESFIGIPNVDPPSLCEPFTPDELQKFGEKVEAIDRTGREAEFVVTATQTARAKLPGQSAMRSRRPQADGAQQFSPQAAEAARLAMVPPAGGEAARISASGGAAVQDEG
jgi:hypothetical protein